MRFYAALIVGMFLAFISPSMPWVIWFGGLAVGVALTFADIRWPRAKPVALHRMDRPDSLTPLNQAVAAILLLTVGVGGALLLWGDIGPNARKTELIFFYMTGLAVGAALALPLAARRIRERHNEWLASLDAKSGLEV